MNEITLTCPACRHEFPLNKSLAEPMLKAKSAEFEELIRRKDAEIAERERSVAHQRQELDVRKEQVEEEVARRLAEDRQRISEEEARRAKAFVAAEMADRDRELLEARDLLAAREEKLAEAQKSQADMMRKERELADAQRELELTVEKRVKESVDAEADKAKRRAEEELGLKLRERDEQIGGLQRQIEVLRQKADQGSQQLQGEAQELQLEDLLKAKFPFDRISPVAKGQSGADLVQEVLSSSGQVCGTIIWEIKRTRTWSDAWLPKLRTDQRELNADCAVIVSNATPKDFRELFDRVDGVWVAQPHCAIAVAGALREFLVTHASVRVAAEGQETKQQAIYAYMTGPAFRHRIEAVVERFREMQDDLSRERRTMTKLWARRQQQINSAIGSTAGMFGDLQGLASKDIGEIEGLDFLALPSGPNDDPEHDQNV